MTFVTSPHMLNMKHAGIVSLAALESRIIPVNVYAIFLPLELKVISRGFNCEGCNCEGCY